MLLSSCTLLIWVHLHRISGNNPRFFRRLVRQFCSVETQKGYRVSANEFVNDKSTDMKKINNLLLLLVIGVVFASCGKNGDAGPQGATGPTGAVGPAGPAGANGQNGSVIYSGTTVPPTTTGVKGDFYLNISTGLLYGPKTDTGWGSGFLLVGPQGAAGAAGNTILSGTGTPDAALGKAGDYFLDKSSYLLYGPKTVATNFRDTTADNSALHAADLSAPSLTTNILNSAQIQVYFNFGGGVYALPYTSYAGGKLNTMSYLPRLGHFIITRFTSDNSNSVALSTILQYRYIIIPGGVAVAAANPQHIDLNDYEAVRKFYRIKD